MWSTTAAAAAAVASNGDRRRRRRQMLRTILARENDENSTGEKIKMHFGERRRVTVCAPCPATRRRNARVHGGRRRRRRRVYI